jgi:hypothetical protein
MDLGQVLQQLIDASKMLPGSADGYEGILAYIIGL